MSFRWPHDRAYILFGAFGMVNYTTKKYLAKPGRHLEYFWPLPSIKEEGLYVEGTL